MSGNKKFPGHAADPLFKVVKFSVLQAFPLIKEDFLIYGI